MSDAPSPHFCLYPFTHIATKTDGSLKLCCRSEAIGNIKDADLGEHWNSERLRAVRLKFLKGEKPSECEACWRNEEVGTRSMRQRSMSASNRKSRWNLYRHVLQELDPQTGQLHSPPKSLEIKTSNICNLKCRMCHPVDSSSWAKDWPEIEHLMKDGNTWAYEKVKAFGLTKKPILSSFENKSWFAQVGALADGLETIEFAGGEPLLDPSHHKLLLALHERAPHITLKYSTNLTTLKAGSTEVMELWKPFKRVNIYISMDGVGETYNYIRSNGDFADIEKNLELLKKADIPLGEVAVACTVQIYNIFNITKVADFCIRNGILFHLHYVSYPKFLNVQIMPQAAKGLVVTELRAYLDRLLESSVPIDQVQHISRHLKDLINYVSTDRDKDLLVQFRQYTRILDRQRQTNFSSLHPLARCLMESSIPG